MCFFHNQKNKVFFKKFCKYENMKNQIQPLKNKSIKIYIDAKCIFHTYIFHNFSKVRKKRKSHICFLQEQQRTTAVSLSHAHVTRALSSRHWEAWRALSESWLWHSPPLWAEKPDSIPDLVVSLVTSQKSSLRAHEDHPTTWPCWAVRHMEQPLLGH